MQMKLDLVGVAEIAEMLGISRQRVHAISQSHDEFPAPVADLSAGKIWHRHEVVAWARAHRQGNRQTRLTPFPPE